MSDALPTPRSTLQVGYVRVLVWCKACRHQADADLPALVSAGRGDVAQTALAVGTDPSPAPWADHPFHNTCRNVAR